MWAAGVDASGSADAVPPTLPVTWRPRLGRIVPQVLIGPVVAISVFLAVVVPPQYKLTDRVAFVLFGLGLGACLYFLARPKVRARADGITVVNIVRGRTLAWSEVLDVTMPRGEPWPTLDLADGTTLAAMGIQTNDGRHAQTALAELQALVHARGEATEP